MITEEARVTCVIVDAAVKVRDLNLKYRPVVEGATVTARFVPGGITFVDLNRC